MLYIAIAAENGTATIGGVSHDRNNLKGKGRIFEIKPASIPGLCNATDASNTIIDWLIDEGVIGADLTQARMDIGDSIKKHLGIANDAKLTKVMESPLLEWPMITGKCPACGKSAGGMKRCMLPGGKGCCPWVVCGACRYTGPIGRDAVDAISRWNAGEVDPAMLFMARTDNENEDIDVLELRRNIEWVLNNNSKVHIDKVIDVLNANPGIATHAISYIKSIRERCEAMMERIMR